MLWRLHWGFLSTWDSASSLHRLHRLRLQRRTQRGLAVAESKGRPGPQESLRGLGCQRGRRAVIDDHQHRRQGAALSCCVGAGRSAPARHLAGAEWPPGRLESRRRNVTGKLRSDLCGRRELTRPAQLRGFGFPGSLPKTRGSFGQSESGSASLSTALDSERSMDVRRSQMPSI